MKILIRRFSGGGPVTGSVRVKDVVLEDIGPARQYPATPYLTAIASTNQKNDKLYLMVISKHLTNSLKTKIRVRHFAMMDKGTSWTLNGPSIDATNENCKESVKILRGSFSTSPSADYFEFVFEPHFLTALEIEKD